jgi:hypothetical protein
MRSTSPISLRGESLHSSATQISICTYNRGTPSPSAQSTINLCDPPIIEPPLTLQGSSVPPEAFSEQELVNSGTFQPPGWSTDMPTVDSSRELFSTPDQRPDPSKDCDQKVASPLKAFRWAPQRKATSKLNHPMGELEKGEHIQWTTKHLKAKKERELGKKYVLHFKITDEHFIPGMKYPVEADLEYLFGPSAWLRLSSEVRSNLIQRYKAVCREHSNPGVPDGLCSS